MTTTRRHGGGGQQNVGVVCPIFAISEEEEEEVSGEDDGGGGPPRLRGYRERYDSGSESESDSYSKDSFEGESSGGSCGSDEEGGGCSNDDEDVGRSDPGPGGSTSTAVEGVSGAPRGPWEEHGTRNSDVDDDLAVAVIAVGEGGSRPPGAGSEAGRSSSSGGVRALRSSSSSAASARPHPCPHPLQEMAAVPPGGPVRRRRKERGEDRTEDRPPSPLAPRRLGAPPPSPGPSRAPAVPVPPTWKELNPDRDVVWGDRIGGWGVGGRILRPA